MKEKFIKPEIEVITIAVEDVIMTSPEMMDAKVMSFASYASGSEGMAGGTVGGNATFNSEIFN